MKDYEHLSKVHFDNQAKVYDETDTMYYSKYPKISCRHVGEYLKTVEFDSLLDVGCGTGFLINMLRKSKAANYFGLDLSTEMIKVAERKLGGDVNLTVGSADKLTYEDGSFDVVTCIQSFHHYPYPEKAMREAFRVLRAGGRYIISDTGYGGLKQIVFNKIVLPRMNSGDYAVYSMKDIELMMKNTGFTLEKAEKVSGMIYTVVGRKQVDFSSEGKV